MFILLQMACLVDQTILWPLSRGAAESGLVGWLVWILKVVLHCLTGLGELQRTLTFLTSLTSLTWPPLDRHEAIALEDILRRSRTLQVPPGSMRGDPANSSRLSRPSIEH